MLMSPVPMVQEAAASRAARLAQQSCNPNYLKDSARSPIRQVGTCAGYQSVAALGYVILKLLFYLMIVLVACFYLLNK
jgi:hypothetical protein